jgi:hypothetical protein
MDVPLFWKGKVMSNEGHEPQHEDQKERVDVLSTTSGLPGLAGYFETFLRRFRSLSFSLCLSPIIVLGVLCMGVSLVPGIYLYRLMDSWTHAWPQFLHIVALGCALAFAFLAYGLTIIFVVPLVNFLMPFKVKPWRGSWFSLQTIPWYIHNALTYIVRYTFLDFITPTPLNVLFYRLMGMKIGKGVIINTSNISDPCLITLEDYVTIGGSATLFAHYGQKGYLIISKVHIKKGATIGLKASIMGDVVIGENVNLKAHSVVMPKSRIDDNETV